MHEDPPQRRSTGACLAAIVLACAPATAACSYLLSSGLDDAHGGSDASGDAGTPADAGAAADAAREDGGAASDADAGRGCASYAPTPKFCDDFEKGSLTGWGISADPANGRLVANDTTQAWSGTHALKATLTNAASCSYARIERTFAGIGTSRQEVRFRLRPGVPDTTPFAFTIDSNHDATSCTALLYLHGANGAVTASSVNVQSAAKNDDQRGLTGAPPLDGWTDVAVVATPASAGGVSMAFTFTFDDGTTSRSDYTFSQCKLGDALTVYPGFHCESGSETVWLDDVRADWE